MEIFSWTSMNSASMVGQSVVTVRDQEWVFIYKNPYSDSFYWDIRSIPGAVYLSGRGFLIPLKHSEQVNELLLSHFGTDGTRTDLHTVRVSAAHRLYSAGVYLADMNRRLPFRVAWRDKETRTIQLADKATIVSGSFDIEVQLPGEKTVLGENNAVIEVPIFTPLWKQLRYAL